VFCCDVVAGINVMLLLELMCSAVMLLLYLMCSAVMIVAGINVMLLLELMCSAVMFVAGINVFYCDDCAEIDAPDCVLRSEILFRCRN
jgi:mannose/fructose-specific phosphotransferase system component IIA